MQINVEKQSNSGRMSLNAKTERFIPMKIAIVGAGKLVTKWLMPCLAETLRNGNR
jgi:hypothetical protein